MQVRAQQFMHKSLMRGMRCTTINVKEWVLCSAGLSELISSASPWPCESHFKDTETANPRTSLSTWEVYSMMLLAGQHGTSWTAVFSCIQEIIKQASRQEPAEGCFLIDLLTPGPTSHSLEPIIFPAKLEQRPACVCLSTRTQADPVIMRHQQLRQRRAIHRAPMTQMQLCASHPPLFPLSPAPSNN